MTAQAAQEQQVTEAVVSVHTCSYIVVIVIAGAGVFLYRKQKQGAKKAEYKASENDSSSGMLKH